MSAEHRKPMNRALIGAVVVLALVLLAHLPDGAVSLAYLSPAMFVFLLLCLGRYPGERMLAALSRSPRRSRRSKARAAPPRVPLDMRPRVGRLLARSLAGRAPPLVALRH
jgi:hypothetical protein